MPLSSSEYRLSQVRNFIVTSIYHGVNGKHVVRRRLAILIREQSGKTVVGGGEEADLTLGQGARNLGTLVEEWTRKEGEILHGSGLGEGDRKASV